VAAVTWGLGAQVTVASAQMKSNMRYEMRSMKQQTKQVVQKATSLSDVSSYTIYYGAQTAWAIKKLSQYEIVIIEPRNWSQSQLAQLKQSGVKVLGYLSVLEQNQASTLLGQAVDSDYLLINGQRDARYDGESWSMNINSEHYRQLLFADYEQQIVGKGLDGVFLDTMGDVDDGIWSDAVSNSELDGAVKFVADLRSKYPILSIMQNWGLQALKDRTTPYIDGIMWEDFTPKTVLKNAWSLTRMQELDKLHQESGLSVFTSHVGLSNSQKALFDQVNRQHGYVGTLIKSSYDSI
jgi:endo-alpha-1,4-polygalactosaminidase (GH114 family)